MSCQRGLKIQRVRGRVHGRAIRWLRKLGHCVAVFGKIHVGHSLGSLFEEVDAFGVIGLPECPHLAGGHLDGTDLVKIVGFRIAEGALLAAVAGAWGFSSRGD